MTIAELKALMNKHGGKAVTFYPDSDTTRADCQAVVKMLHSLPALLAAIEKLAAYCEASQLYSDIGDRHEAYVAAADAVDADPICREALDAARGKA